MDAERRVVALLLPYSTALGASGLGAAARGKAPRGAAGGVVQPELRADPHGAGAHRSEGRPRAQPVSDSEASAIRVREGEIGVYVHVPFCERLCPYCDFAVSVQREIPHQAYVERVAAELKARAGEFEGYEAVTLYVGGGTPSLLSGEALGALFEAVRGVVSVHEGAEVTLEANPNQLTAANLAAWKELGVERLSVGCQSFQDAQLKALRRNHSAAQAIEGVERALEVMERVSIDLMFGVPGQTMGSWEADLAVMQRLVEERGLDHVSAYNLTVEPGTAFWIRRKRGSLSLPDEDTSANFLERLVERTAEVGLWRYEVSNFAVPGGESRHNSGYWLRRPYVGVGVGAHSLRVAADGRSWRRANAKKYAEYMEQAEPGAPKSEEALSARESFGEHLFLGARSRLGLDLSGLFERYAGVLSRAEEARVGEAVEGLEALGLLERLDGDRVIWRPTLRGLDLGDTVAERLYLAATPDDI
ncbi:radical SAM family heme chaperone HemW [Lujinxingia sediminis]|uniref:Heme chaperone HemW n=1 Tax=Lujinxingia sediminis TaxID=2480984 RepID=A0ABY0CT71_9DELT|nr:radical SAM family heme chaperone HemW [Lujinxingia sediminis]